MSPGGRSLGVCAALALASCFAVPTGFRATASGTRYLKIIDDPGGWPAALATPARRLDEPPDEAPLGSLVVGVESSEKMYVDPPVVIEEDEAVIAEYAMERGASRYVLRGAWTADRTAGTHSDPTGRHGVRIRGLEVVVDLYR